MDVHSQVGLRDGTIAAGEIDESKEIDADADDVEDAQPNQVMPTPDVPPRAVIDEHRIDRWPLRS